MEKALNNRIMMITFFKPTGQPWQFNYESLGIRNELMIAGASEVITKIAENKGLNLKKVAKAFNLAFSEFPIPDYDAVIDHVVDEDIFEGFALWKRALGKLGLFQPNTVDLGTDYYWKQEDMPLWLCGCLGRFFAKVPKKIYIKVM